MQNTLNHETSHALIVSVAGYLIYKKSALNEK